MSKICSVCADTVAEFAIIPCRDPVCVACLCKWITISVDGTPLSAPRVCIRCPVCQTELTDYRRYMNPLTISRHDSIGIRRHRWRFFQFLKELIPNRNESLVAEWKRRNTKQCPNCRTPIEKNGGCNHMTCKQCGCNFCWICALPKSKHRAMFPCSFAPATAPAQRSTILLTDILSVPSIIFLLWYNGILSYSARLLSHPLVVSLYLTLIALIDFTLLQVFTVGKWTLFALISVLKWRVIQLLAVLGLILGTLYAVRRRRSRLQQAALINL